MMTLMHATPRLFRPALVQRFFRAKPYDSRDLGGWKIIALNAMQGPTWDPASQRCQPV